jgi:iron complex outermembrane recepter protein
MHETNRKTLASGWRIFLADLSLSSRSQKKQAWEQVRRQDHGMKLSLRNFIPNWFCAVCLFLVCVQPVPGEDKKIEFDIPRSGADRALNLFALQADIQLLYPYDVVKHINVGGLSGDYFVDDGLTELLRNTCLEAVFSNNGNGEGIRIVKNNQCQKKELATSVSAAVLSMLGAAPVLAQQEDPQVRAGLEEVIVTARKREESLQGVPMAVTAISEELLREKSIEGPYDLAFHVPGLVVRPGSASRGLPEYFLRGQGSAAGGPPGVVTYFNEVPLKSAGLAGSNIQFFDLESVQVLKGPQGTLFGRSSTGGAVLYAPKKPSDELGGYIDTKTGNLNLFEVSATVNVPLFEGKLAVRAGVNVQRRDGFTESQSTGQDLEERHRESYRLGINFKPTDWFENYTMIQTNRVNENPTGPVLVDYNANLAQFNTTPMTGGGWLGAAGLCRAISAPAAVPGCIAQRTARIDQLSADLRSELARVQGGGSIRKNLTATELKQSGRNEQIINIATADVGEVGFLGDVTVKNILSFNRNRESNALREFGASRFPHGIVANGYDLVGSPRQLAVNETYGKTSFGDDVVGELQLLGDIGGRHNWILGYFTERGESDFGPPPVFQSFNNAFTVPLDNLGFLTPTVSRSKDEQTAFFGQFTADLSDALWDGLSVTLGYRKTKTESKSKTYQLIPGIDGLSVGSFVRNVSFEESAPTWTVSIDYQINPSVLVYLAHRRGFKPGGLNTNASSVPGARDNYDPEELDDVEAGIKADWALKGIAGRTNLAVYNSWYNEVQRRETILLPGTGAVFTQTNNIAKAEISGLELENQFVLSDRFQFFLNYAWTDARNKRWPGQTTSVFGGTYSNLENKYPGVAEHQGTIGARYVLPIDERFGTASFVADYYLQSGVWLDDTAIQVLPRETGFQESYDDLNVRVDWSNVLGSPIDAGIFVRNVMDDEWIVGANNLMASLGFFTNTFNEPRTYGLQLRYRFGSDGE